GDLEKVAVELLRNQEIADYFRKRYSDVFVDEFQDTNQAQCELVRSISSRNQGLFVVGDVKQSIYRFRGSDVRVFEEFVAEVSSQRVLSTNYRSHPAIIQAVNTVFDGVIRDFQPMRAFRKSEGGDRVFRVDANESAIGIAAAVARARSDGYAPGEIVLLLRRIRGNEKLLEDLRSYGINTVFSLPRDLTENPKLFALCSLWITLHFSDLRGPALHAVAELGITNEEIEDLASRVSETIICTSLLAAIDAQWSMHQRFGITWSLFGDLIYLAHETGMSGPGLAQEFLRLWQGRTPSGTLPLLVNSPEPPVTGSSSIRVTTVHSSKGMEYPVVILADLNDRRRSLGRVSLVKDHVWVFAPDSDGEIDRSSEHFKEALEEEKRESTDESNRLLYVALTRAKEQLYWVDVPGARGVRSGWCDLLHRKLLGQTAEITAASHSERFGEAEPTKVEPIETINDSAPIVPVVPSGIARIPVTEYIKLQRVRGSNKRTFAKDDPSQSDRTAQKGTVVHQYLQREAWEELWMYGDQENLDLSKFRAWLATESGRRVFDRKHAPIPQRLEREAAFEWLHDGHILSGAIDRLIVWSDEAWIIDYKLIQRRGGLGREELQHQYGPQLSLYASIVKKMTHIARTRLFIIDLLASSGEVWVELRQVDDTL
ncbi:MAG TPA: UvrD-helicase domain-containing protein, partial [Oligoflexia bacterium]|nr:UvrD-helicase domain-containing protein [Oligoflexia bacterium]